MLLFVYIVKPYMATTGTSTLQKSTMFIPDYKQYEFMQNDTTTGQHIRYGYAEIWVCGDMELIFDCSI